MGRQKSITGRDQYIIVQALERPASEATLRTIELAERQPDPYFMSHKQQPRAGGRPGAHLTKSEPRKCQTRSSTR
jgi:hypothetical protein